MVQNRFHYAITGQTAAEIIYTKADHAKEHMGLTTWKNSPDGRILKSDVSVAKNYLTEKRFASSSEQSQVISTTSKTLSNVKTHSTWSSSQHVNEFLAFRRYEILPDKGSVSVSRKRQG